MDIYEIIEELENEFDASKNFLWSKKSLVDNKKCAELVGKLKRSLPSAITEAGYMLSRRDQILSDAQKEADEILQEARQRAEMLVAESEIVKSAEKCKKDLETETKNTCDKLQENVKSNVDKMLKSIEDYLMENLMIVRNNREELAGEIKKKK